MNLTSEYRGAIAEAAKQPKLKLFLVPEDHSSRESLPEFRPRLRDLLGFSNFPNFSEKKKKKLEKSDFVGISRQPRTHLGHFAPASLEAPEHFPGFSKIFQDFPGFSRVFRIFSNFQTLRP